MFTNCESDSNLIKFARKVLGIRTRQLLAQECIALTVCAMFMVVLILTAKDGLTIINVAAFAVSMIALSVGLTLLTTEADLREMLILLYNDEAEKPILAKAAKEVLKIKIWQVIVQKVITLMVGAVSVIVLLITVRSGITAINVASFVISIIVLPIGITLFATESDLREVFMILNNGVEYALIMEDESDESEESEEQNVTNNTIEGEDRDKVRALDSA